MDEEIESMDEMEDDPQPAENLPDSDSSKTERKSATPAGVEDQENEAASGSTVQPSPSLADQDAPNQHSPLNHDGDTSDDDHPESIHPSAVQAAQDEPEDRHRKPKPFGPRQPETASGAEALDKETENLADEHDDDVEIKPEISADAAADISDRFRRLIIGGPILDSSDSPPESLPNRHPTGSPEKTGGWYSQDIDALETNDVTHTNRVMGTSGAAEDDTPRSPMHPQEPAELPRRVPERDVGATQVTPAAFARATPPPPPSSRSRFLREMSGFSGCLLRMGILGLFALIALGIAFASLALYQYSIIASSLPSVEDLQQRAAQFETTRILDREGNLLYEILDPQEGRRTYVPIEDISPFMIAATIATEDSLFYTHPGFDPRAIVRAFLQNFQEGEIVSGSSTITQQIARNLILDPEERSQRTALRKIREILIAQEITRRYTKDEILELYLNQSYFGNLAYGVEAAAETYFNTSADRLTLMQSSFLAGLVQAPSVYDVFTNREATLDRQKQVLSLLIETSNQQGCIYVSNNPQPICISPEEAVAAADSLVDYNFTLATFGIRFPHWVTYIRSELEKLYDPQTIYRSGFTVYTTLDPNLQDQAQELVKEQVAGLAERRASDGALVVIRPNTGEILAMIGSADFYNEDIDGQVNMAIRPRQPGSSIKPLTYTAAFEKGWTPATLIWDVPSEFPPSGNPNDTRAPYKPVNYDRRYHGPVTVRSALANSYNIPAVKALDFVGVYDDPLTPERDGFIELAERMGITTYTQDDFGLSLTLGGGGVTLLDMTSAFSVFANDGVRIPYYSITRISDLTGETVYEYEIPEGEQVIRAEHAYLISSILSDNNARTPGFGSNSVLNLPFQVAAKTGTSDDFTDSWTLGYTPDVAIGVWVGNADYTGMQNLSGLRGAGPIWSQFMEIAIEYLTGGFPTGFEQPAGIDELAICSISGAQPSEWCPSHRVEIFAFDQPPLPKEQDLWQRVWIDSWTLELASADCPNYATEKMGLDIRDPWARKWIEEKEAGKEWAEKMGFTKENIFLIPTASCTSDSSRPIVLLTLPNEGSTVSLAPIDIFGKAAATSNFKDWVLQYGTGFDPQTWTRIKWSDMPYTDPANLMTWDAQNVENGSITLRLVVRNENGGNADYRLPITINLATPTPTLTPTPTITVTPTPSMTPTITLTPTASNTPTPSNTPTSPTPATPLPTTPG